MCSSLQSDFPEVMTRKVETGMDVGTMELVKPAIEMYMYDQQKYILQS